MTEARSRSFTLSIGGYGACVPDEKTADAFNLKECEIDLSMLAPMIRRRTSLATRIAISAATRACEHNELGTDLPAIFVSAMGEIQTTNKLCSAISQQQYPLSPTLFHNSVHNTAAGYWSIAATSMAPMQAMAALNDCFQVGLLEAWTQINAGSGGVLLVCYDEDLPPELLPDYNWQPCATALILEPFTEGNTSLTVPYHPSQSATRACLETFSKHNQAAITLPLIGLLQRGDRGVFQVPLDPCNTETVAQLKIA